MIDEAKRLSRLEQKEKVRKRIQVTVDPDNYEYIPAKNQSIITMTKYLKESQYMSVFPLMIFAKLLPMSF